MWLKQLCVCVCQNESPLFMGAEKWWGDQTQTFKMRFTIYGCLNIVLMLVRVCELDLVKRWIENSRLYYADAATITGHWMLIILSFIGHHPVKQCIKSFPKKILYTTDKHKHPTQIDNRPPKRLTLILNLNTRFFVGISQS